MYSIRHFLRLSILVAIMELPAFAGNVTLAWYANTNPVITGYNIYFWIKGGASTNKVSAGNATSVTISNLVAGCTYLFAATTYDASGLESPLSAEVSLTVPANVVNQPPTLNAPGNLTVNENAGPQIVNLSGITSGAANENQMLHVTAVSSNLTLIPNPTVNYTSPNTTGSLAFTPVPYATGTAIITVTVDDGAAISNLVTRTFTVNVLSFNDTTRPSDQITAPTANLRVSNAAFTVTGNASDNVGMGAVYYSLNGSGWTMATTTNYWAKWMADVMLTPGPNTLRTYAVDTSGNISATNSASFVYVVNAMTTVHISGNGTVNPNYNGALLAINENYTMTASASSGFGFTNWTDSSGNVVTNRATLQFTMVTNLTLTANFVDVQKPTVSIVNPASNQQWTNGTFTVTGKASDNVAVGAVYYSLNGSDLTAATTGNGWTNWTANVTLTPGTNSVQAYAVDNSGNISPTNTVKFEYVVLKPLAVRINGKGTVNQNYNGALLAINENYTMTASAASGFAFTNWMNGSGNAMTNRATLQFTMVTNLTLTANFADVTRPALSLVTPASNTRVSNTVFAVTGKAGDNVAVGAVYYSLNGSSWTAATTGNNWTNWTALVILKSGTNTVQAYAVDTSGNTSPTNSNTVNLVVPPGAPATLDSAAYANGQYAFVVSGASGYKYMVQSSTDLVNWVSLQTNTAPFTFTDTNAGQFSQRFYRSIFNP